MCRVFGGAFGGPVAAFRDESKIVLHLGAFSRPDIQLFDAAGAATGRVLWDKGRIASAGWTSGEELLVVDERAHVHRFTARGEPSGAGPPFSLGAACEEEGLAQVAVFADGVVAVTPGGRLWCVSDASQPRAQRYPDPAPPGGEVHCLAPVPPAASASGTLEVLAALDDSVVLVDADQALPGSATFIADGPVVRLAPSPDGRFVAGVSAGGGVHIWSGDLSESVAHVGVDETAEDMAEALGRYEEDVDSGVPTRPPDALAWCGSDAVVVWWERVGALLVSVEGGWRWWDLGGAGACLVPEVDGLRVLATESHVLLRRVPPPLASVLEMGSTSPGALLYDARRLYEERDARAAAELLDVLRSGGLPEAVSACLLAAAAELDLGKQEALMRAGCYGRAFLALQDGGGMAGAAGVPGLGSHDTVEVARKLRVLNALREASVAMPLTMAQLDALGTTALAELLTGRRHYLLAMRVCQALGASAEGVLARWACDKITHAASSAHDEVLLGALRSKLEGQAGVRWARVAAHAQAQGRHALAASLLDFEPCAGEQVPLLVQLGEEERALGKAVAAGDGDLVFWVAHAMWRRLERGDGCAAGNGAAAQRFWAAVAAQPFAAALLAQYFSGRDPELVLAMREGLGQREAVAEVHLRSAAAAAAAGAPESRVQGELAQAKDQLYRAEREGREDRFEAGAAGAAARLRELQADLQASSGREAFLGLSVVDTVRQCLRLGMREQAQRLAREFKVPEKQQALLAAQAAAVRADWAALQQMATKLDRRAPITVEQLVTVVRAHNAPLPTVRWLIDRISGDNALVRRARLYADLGLHREAAALVEQAELQGAGTGVLGSLRDAVGGTMGGFIGRVAPAQAPR